MAQEIEVVDDRSVRERLEEVGVFITEKKMDYKKMLVDVDGKELGHFSPLGALKEFCGYKGEVKD